MNYAANEAPLQAILSTVGDRLRKSSMVRQGGNSRDEAPFLLKVNVMPVVYCGAPEECSVRYVSN